VPNIGNAFFSTPIATPIAIPVATPEQKPTGAAGVRESEGKIGDKGLQEEVMPFLSVLTQFAEDLRPNKNTIVDPMAWFNANNNENKNGNENVTDETPLFVREGNNPFFSKSVLDLLPSLGKDLDNHLENNLENNLEKNTEEASPFEWVNTVLSELDALSKLDESEDRVLSREDISRLEAMLAKFRKNDLEDDDSLFKTAFADLKYTANNWQKRQEKDETPFFGQANEILNELGETGDRVLSRENISRIEAMLATFRGVKDDLKNDLKGNLKGDLEDDDIQLSLKTVLTDLKLLADSWTKHRKKGETLPLKDLRGQGALDGQEQEKTEERNLPLRETLLLTPLLVEDNPKGETADLSKSRVFSHFASYLETDLSLKMKEKEKGNADASEEKTEWDERLSSAISRIPEQGELAVPTFSERTSPRNEFSTERDVVEGSPQEKLGSLNRNTANVGANLASSADAKEDSPLSGSENEKGASVKPKAEEHKSGFEQFFDGVRRGETRGDVHRESLNLAKDAPLPRNEALREGLDNVVRFIRVSGEQKAALIVDPPALGRISVELTNNAVGLEASIKVGSEQARQLIQDQLAQLRWSLAQQGVQLTHFSVDVQQDNGRREQGQNSDRRRVEASTRNDMDEGEETVFRVDLDQGLLYWVA
jgi:hypothetical protein